MPTEKQRRTKTPKPRKAPEVVVWETTLACNMRCEHCGSTAGKPRPDELTPLEAQQLCRELIALGVQRVDLSGGETLMRPDWPALVETLLRGIPYVGLLTNGWTLDDATLTALSRYAKTGFHLFISLDGTAAMHDRIRMRQGSFARATHGAAALKQRGIPVAVITSISAANFRDMPSLRDQIFDVIQPYAWQLQLVCPYGRAAAHDDYRMTPAQYGELLSFVAETRSKGLFTRTRVVAGDCMGYRSSIDSELRPEPWQGCQAGLQVLGIQANGNVKGCLSIIDDRFIEGNVRTAGLAAIWRRAGGFAYTRAFDRAQLQGACAECPEGAICRGGCNSNAIAVHGEPGHAPYCYRLLDLPPARQRPRRSAASRRPSRPRQSRRRVVAPPRSR